LELKFVAGQWVSAGPEKARLVKSRAKKNEWNRGGKKSRNSFAKKARIHGLESLLNL